MNELITIENKDGVLLVNSREVAERFEKQHKDVLETIRNLAAENSAVKNICIKSNYETRGKEYPEYLLTRDGFSLLAMGFTGAKALEWKLKFLEAFNRMEADLKNKLIPTGQELIALAWVEINNILEETKNTVKVQEQLISELKPLADYTDIILKNKGLVTITQISKDYGMSGFEMNQLLYGFKIQYKLGEQWLMYAKYQSCGYTHSETVNYKHSDGRSDIKMMTKWSQKGRLFIYKILRENDVIPLIEQELAV